MPEKICPACQSELVYKSGTSRKNGKPYAFWGCSGYPVCEYTEPAPKAPQTAPQSDKSPTPAGNAEIINALRQIYLLLDDRLPKEKFPEPPEEKLPFEGDQDISQYI